MCEGGSKKNSRKVIRKVRLGEGTYLMKEGENRIELGRGMKD